MFLKSPFGEVTIKVVKYVSKNSALTSANNQARAMTSGMLRLIYELKIAQEQTPWHATRWHADTLTRWHADTLEWNFLVTLSSSVI